MTVKTIGTAARDYSTIQAWEDATPNLVSTTQTWEGECYNDSVLAGFTVAGNTTSATYFMKLTAASGQGFADHANKLTNALKYNSSNGVCVGTGGSYANLVNLSQSYLTISRLQFKQANASGTTRTIDAADGYSGVVIRECIIENESDDAAVVLRGSGAKIINCLAAKRTSNATTGDAIDLLYGADAYNCTAVKTSDNAGALAIGTYGGDATVVNCAMFGFTTALSSSGYTASNYNATDTSGMADSGPNDVESLTYANQFENTTDASQDFRVKSGSGLAAGTRDATNTSDLDIIGQARSTTTPTIGCWEYVASGATYTLTAASGSLALTGVATGLRASRLLTAAQATYTLTGNATVLGFTRLITAVAGSFTLTGTATGLLASRLLSATTQTYALTGNAATLGFTRIISAVAQSYVLTGNAATLTYNSSATYTLSAAAGSYTLTGQAIGFIRSLILTASTGTFSMTGISALLTYSGESIWEEAAATSKVWSNAAAGSGTWAEGGGTTNTWSESDQI